MKYRHYIVEIPAGWGENELKAFREEVEKTTQIIESARRAKECGGNE